MSLWTPGGEHPVGSDEGSDASSGPGSATPSFDDLSPEQQGEAQDMAREMAQAQAAVAAAPAADVVANHLMGFYELAAIHLSQEPPNFAQATVAIDAMSAVLEAMVGRLGDNETTLRDGLSQIRMAFVQLQSKAQETEGDATPAE